MIFSNFERSEAPNQITFINKNPIENIGDIKFYVDDSSGSFTRKEFRWSFNNVYWSSWENLTQSSISSINVSRNRCLFLEIRYIGSGKVTTFTINYSESTYVEKTEEPKSTKKDPISCDTLSDYQDTCGVEKVHLTSCNLLDGKPGSYFLWRPNHKGQQSISTIIGLEDRLKEIIEYLNEFKGINVGGGKRVYKGKQGSSFIFRTLRGLGGIEIREEENELMFYFDASTAQSIYDSTLDSSIEAPNTIGGIEAGTTVGDLLGRPLSELWDLLLFPAVFPTLTNPSATFTISPSGLQEIGNSFNITATATFDRGSINPQYDASTQYRSGDSNFYEYEGVGLVDVSTSDLVDEQIINNYEVQIGNQPLWRSRVYYDKGPQPTDSKGNDYDLPLDAGNTNYINRTFEGVYPLFGTTNNITNPNTKQTLRSMLNANNIVFSMVPESGGNKQSFDIPDAWTGAPTNRPLTDVETFNTVSSQWESTGLGQWTTSSVTHTVQGNTVNYTRYTYNGSDRGDIEIRLKF